MDLLAQYPILRNSSCWHSGMSATKPKGRFDRHEATIIRLVWFLSVRICYNELSYPHHLGQYTLLLQHAAH